MRHAATLRRLVRCVFTRAHECIWGGSGERGSPLRSSSSYFQRAIIKGKAGRERCARVKGKGINYCRVPGEICKLNSARARERERRGGRVFFFFHPSPLLSTRRVSTAATPRFWLRPIDSPVFFRPVWNFRRKRKSCGSYWSIRVVFFFLFFSWGWDKFLNSRVVIINGGDVVRYRFKFSFDLWGKGDWTLSMQATILFFKIKGEFILTLRRVWARNRSTSISFYY